MKRLIEIADTFREKNVEFVSIQDKLDTSTPALKAMFGMLSVLAEFERDIIRERTMAGLKERQHVLGVVKVEDLKWVNKS
jgi:DNA invertase Pin-like site-specific DNA recombinase